MRDTLAPNVPEIDCRAGEVVPAQLRTGPVVPRGQDQLVQAIGTGGLAGRDRQPEYRAMSSTSKIHSAAEGRGEQA